MNDIFKKYSTQLKRLIKEVKIFKIKTKFNFKWNKV